MKTKPNLSSRQLYDISFGFFGVQIAYALQSANVSRIFATLGADPHSLSYFWILPPLMGMIVQPLVGFFSDKTWCRFGRRIPYLFIGALVAVIVMCLLPNAGSFSMTVATAMTFGLVALMFLDTSINMAMQPFKMMVGDLVNEQQKAKAYSIQSFLCNAGSIVGYIFPLFFTWIGIKNKAPKGVVPDSVIWSFYIGAAILILCVIYTVTHVREMPPEEYVQYQDTVEDAKGKVHVKEPQGAWKVFFEVGLVQFFCWAAFLYMWTYTGGTIGHTVWHTLDTSSRAYQDAGNWVGVLFAVQAVGSVCWALVLPKFKSTKAAYALSLLIGAIGFALVPYCANAYLLFVPFILIGFAWAAMLAMPFTFVTNAFEGSSRMGTVLGLFNCTICLPQIIAAATGGLVMAVVCHKEAGVFVQDHMFLAAAAFLVIATLCVFAITTKKHSTQA